MNEMEFFVKLNAFMNTLVHQFSLFPQYFTITLLTRCIARQLYNTGLTFILLNVNNGWGDLFLSTYFSSYKMNLNSYTHTHQFSAFPQVLKLKITRAVEKVTPRLADFTLTMYVDIFSAATLSLSPLTSIQKL